MSDLIFGYSWEKIQRMQQGKPVRELIDMTTLGPSPATEEDKKLLREKGVDWLKKKRYDGVLERLKHEGLI